MNYLVKVELKVFLKIKKIKNKKSPDKPKIWINFVKFSQLGFQGITGRKSSYKKGLEDWKKRNKAKLQKKKLG